MIDVLVVYVGEFPWARHTVPFLRNYCRRHGYRLHWVRQVPPYGDPHRSPSWLKLLCGRLLPESDFVLCVDLDMAPLPHAGPIHEVLDLTKINLVAQPVKPRLRRHLKEFGICDPDKPLYNGGLVGVPRSYMTPLEGVYKLSPLIALGDGATMLEQGPLNRWIQDCRVDVHALEWRWNWMPGRLFRPRDADRGASFVHFAGHPRRRQRRCETLWEFYYGSGAAAVPHAGVVFPDRQRPAPG